MDAMRRKMDSAIRAWAKGDDRRPLLIQGARRVGKTFTISHVCSELCPHGFVRLDFQTDLEHLESVFSGPTDDIDGLVRKIAEYKRVPLSPAGTILFFDEVQLCEKALNSLRFFEDSPWRVVASGSTWA